MIEAFYALTIIAFASLSVLTMLNRLIRGGEVRDAVRVRLQQPGQRLRTKGWRYTPALPRRPRP